MLSISRTVQQLFDSIEKPKKSVPANYSGLKILAVVLPLFLLFALLGKAGLGLAVTLDLGVIILAIKVRWELRIHAWFWLIITCLVVLHGWLLFAVVQPAGWLTTLGSLHAIGLFPLALIDIITVLQIIHLAEKVFRRVKFPGL